MHGWPPVESWILFFRKTIKFSENFRILVFSIKCYVCNATSSPFQCGELFERYDEPDIEPVDCSSVHGAQYCVKHIGRFEGDSEKEGDRQKHNITRRLNF